MTRNTYRIVAAAGIALGGLAALIFAIANFLYAEGIFELFIRHGYGYEYGYSYQRDMTALQRTSTIYAVLLLLILLGAVALGALLFTKFKDKEDRYGPSFAILPIWGIEAFSLLVIDYSAMGRGDAAAITTLVLTLLIFAAGSIGIALMNRGKRIAGRILITIFLVVVLVGTILNLTVQNEYPYVQGMSVCGNILRLLALIPICIALYAPVRDGAVVSVEQPRPAPQQPKYEKPAMPKAEPVVREPVEPKKEEPKQSLREKLLEAKALHDDGLISEEEYAEIKKQAIENK